MNSIIGKLVIVTGLIGLFCLVWFFQPSQNNSGSPNQQGGSDYKQQQQHAPTESEIPEKQGGCDYELLYPKGSTSSPNHLTLEDPLVLEDISQWEDSVTSLRLVRPDKKGLLRIKSGQKVRLACTGEGNGFKNIPNEQYVVAECDNSKFRILGEYYEKTQLKCVKPHVVLVETQDYKKKSSLQCPNSAKGYAIGYRINSSAYLTVIELCRADMFLDTTITKYIIVPGNSNSMDQAEKLSFQSDEVIENSRPLCDIRRAYEENQARLFKNAVIPAKYSKRGSFLVPAQLVPAEDFLIPHEVHATFFYANTAPLHRTINNGHWELLRRAVHKYAKIHDVVLEVYTGTFGVSRMDGVNEERSAMCSTKFEGNLYERFPVPLFFWKVAVDRQNRRALGFLVSNNPFDPSGNELHALNYGTHSKWFPPPSEQRPELGWVIVCDPSEMLEFVSQHDLSRNLQNMTGYLKDLIIDVDTKQIDKPANFNRRP